jgi:hypothetical protein
LPSHKNFSKKSRIIKDGSNDNTDNSSSYDPINEENIDIDAWVKFISYYRYYVDEFATEILKLKLYPFQKVILRAMARYQNSMFIACRGLGKSYLSAVFFICISILYPNIKCGIASGVGQQARNVIIQKIKGELIKNENIAREIIFPIKTGADDCVVNFKNGSEIRAITLSQNQGGDSARSWRFHMILIDEAKLVKDEITEEILIPMTKTKRQAAIHHGQSEKGKVIFISSAHLKITDLYKRFRYHYTKMIEGSKDYYVCTLPYQVGVQATIFEEDDILKELDKPTMTKDKFEYEYGAVFVGSSGDSYYPYELTIHSRVLDKCELEQPKKSNSQYIIVHDVAVSDAKGSDNACTHIIKLKEKANGTYFKDVVYTVIHNGATLPYQMQFLRELYHIKFPNTIKIIIDMRGNGEALPSLFYESWEYTDKKTNATIEYPPLILDDDDDGKSIKDAIPIIRGITATQSSNNTMYTYLKACFENNSLRLLKEASEKDIEYKSEEISTEEFSMFIQHDLLVQELSNIKQVMSENNNVLYDRIVKSTKRDRATSLAYGLSIVNDMEIDNRNKNKDGDTDISKFLNLNNNNNNYKNTNTLASKIFR